MRILVLAKEKPGLRDCIRFLKKHADRVDIVIGRRGEPFPKIRRNPDVLISYISPWIVPEKALKKAGIAAINFHPGPPNYPGIGCTNFALYNNERTYGVTAHHMLKQVDRGSIIGVRRFRIRAEDSVLSLTNRSYRHLAFLFKDIMGKFFLTGRFPESQEKWTRAPYTRKELEALCRVTCHMSKKQLNRVIRATTYPGMPGATLSLHGHQFMWFPKKES